jgi:hypothetical protein
MTYELAKQLKDAEFRRRTTMTIRGDALIFRCQNWLHPSLLELIEACLKSGEKKHGFSFELEYFDLVWRANVGWFGHQQTELTSTSEGAVANSGSLCTKNDLVASGGFPPTSTTQKTAVKNTRPTHTHTSILPLNIMESAS